MKTIILTPNDDVNAALSQLKEPTKVILKCGVYRQKIEVRGDGITLCGEDRGKTVITFDDYARKIHADGKEYNTFRTYTLCVTGNNVRLENLTVENSNTDPVKVGQCVALSVHSKFFSAENIDLRSTQDTVFLSPFPDDLVIRYRGFIPQEQLYTEGENVHLFKNCRIYGTVDYVFGCAEAYFIGCEFITLGDGRNYAYVAAPAHSLACGTGFCFIDCNFLGGGAGKGTVYLSRPWRDFGKCNFINCKLADCFNPVLFDKWNDTARDKTARFLYYNLDCAFTPAPVSWARELTDKQANDIIYKCKEKFKEINN